MIANLVVGLLAALICFLFKNKKGLNISFLLVTVFLAIRFEWGNDYQNYLEWFQMVKNYSLGDLITRTEISHHEEWLWSVLNRLFAGVGFFGFVIAITVFENWVIYRTISRHVDSKYYWLSMFIYVLSTKTFALCASMMRQYFCICCFMLVVELMLNRKLIWSIIIIVACSFIHKSNIFALAFLPIFYIHVKQVKVSTSFYIAAGLFYLTWNTIMNYYAVSFMGLLMSEDLQDMYLHYSQRDSKVLSTGIGQLFYMATLITCVYLIPKAEKEEQSFLFLVVVGCLLNPLISIVPMVGRYTLYCNMFLCVIWPLFFKYIKSKPYVIALTAVNGLVILKTFFDFFYSPVWIEHFMEYKTIFTAPSWM